MLQGALLGFSRAEMKRRMDRIVAFAELEDFIDAPAAHLLDRHGRAARLLRRDRRRSGHPPDRRGPLGRRRALPDQVRGAHERVPEAPARRSSSCRTRRARSTRSATAPSGSTTGASCARVPPRRSRRRITSGPSATRASRRCESFRLRPVELEAQGVRQELRHLRPLDVRRRTVGRRRAAGDHAPRPQVVGVAGRRDRTPARRRNAGSGSPRRSCRSAPSRDRARTTSARPRRLPARRSAFAMKPAISSRETVPDGQKAVGEQPSVTFCAAR